MYAMCCIDNSSPRRYFCIRRGSHRYWWHSQLFSWPIGKQHEYWQQWYSNPRRATTIEFTVLSNPELIALTISAVTYPNPTRDYIVLSLTDATLTDLSYIMFDLQGRLITKGKVEQEATQIAMKNLSIGVYILKVNRHNQELKTFKIIKK